MSLSMIAFDADDTLMHCEHRFQQTQLTRILDKYAPHDRVIAGLYKTEARNLALFGYGMKGCTLSMIETAIDISDGAITAADIHEIAMMGRAMLAAPVELIDVVEDVLDSLAADYPVVIITKGDLVDQENKVEQSSLRRFFDHVDILSTKTPNAYRTIFDRLAVSPNEVVMVGNTIPSDIETVLAIGGWAAYIPYRHVALFERHGGEPAHQRYRKLAAITELPTLIDVFATMT